MSLTKAERIAGAMTGLLVGDAVGVSYEFQSASQLPPFDAIDLVPPVGFKKTYPQVPIGTHSDDGATMLCLADSLLVCGRLDLDDFAHRLLRWRRDGLWAVDRHVFDVGVTTQAALARLANGHPPETSGPADEQSAGNGSLMRVLPLALWHTGTDAELVDDAHRSSLPTHGHVIPQVCCAFYCLWARHELNNAVDGWDDALATLQQVYADSAYDEHRRALEMKILPFNSPSGSGYVVDSFWSARTALQRSSDYASAVKHAIAFGRDTDTTAAITGGLAGLRHGTQGIPPEWLHGMRGLDEPMKLIRQFATGAR